MTMELVSEAPPPHTYPTSPPQKGGDSQRSRDAVLQPGV